MNSNSDLFSKMNLQYSIKNGPFYIILVLIKLNNFSVNFFIFILLKCLQNSNIILYTESNDLFLFIVSNNIFYKKYYTSLSE